MALRCCRKFKERMSFVAISLEVLSVLFRPCRLSEFTLTEPLLSPRRRKTKQPVLSVWATAPKGLFRHPGCLFLDRHCTLWAFNVFQTKIFTGNYNLGQNRWEICTLPSPPPPPPPPPPPQIKNGKMARFGFCAASSLIWGNGGLLFHFILSKIVGPVVWEGCRRLEESNNKNDFIYQGLHINWLPSR